MKQLSAIVFFVLLVSISCQKDDEIKLNPNASTQSYSNDGARIAAGTATPVLTRVSGTLGYSSNANNSYPTYIRSEYSGSSILTVMGSNLGSTKGTSSVVFEKFSNNVWSSTSSYSITNIGWSASSLSITLKSSLASEPIAIARFRAIINGVSYASPSFSVVPFIDGRQYEQCTWWVSKRTIDNGLPVSNALYANVNTPIDANYIPTANDILSWGTNVHQAFIESVSATAGTGSEKNITTYVLRISEANVPWSGNQYSTSTKYYNTTVKVKNTNGTKAFVSGFGTFRSTLTAGATLYKAQ